MTRDAYNEFLTLQDALNNLPSDNSDDKHSWSFIWGTQYYSSIKFYQYRNRQLLPERSIIWIWDTKCVTKINFFAWLLLNDRLNTINILKRRNKVQEEGYNCTLCPLDVEEFMDCPSAISRWYSLGISWDENPNVHHKIYIAKQQFTQPYFMEMFMIVAWII